jgi:pectinesterase
VSHLNAEGGRAIAALIVEDLVRAVPELAAHVKLPATTTTTQPAAARAPKIVLVGDSTVTDKAGWGVGFKSRLAGDVKCVNLAQGGRSSKSFRNEGWWEKALAEKGDYVLIQFGHNDQPGKGPERETDPKTTFRENLTRYVAEARAIGTKPVLVTSLERRTFEGAKIRPTLSAYVEATRHVAAEQSVPLIDLNERSTEMYERLGREKWESMSPRKSDGTVDGTHLNAESSQLIGAIVAEELRGVVPELAAHVTQVK